ncbi:MAG: crossover junction endodeoxyribonuclease RuvC [Spirochaetia bacterium]
MKSAVRILGIDPGLASTGFGIIECGPVSYRYIAHHTVATPSGIEIGKRLEMIHDGLLQIIREYHPNEAGVESLYFAKNITSAIPVAQARGVILLTLSMENIPAAEYPPQAIKQALVGNGRAEKGQVQELVKMLLQLSAVPTPDHAADALAAAICHSNTSVIYKRIKQACRGNGDVQ